MGSQSENRNVLIVLPGNIGDSILATPGIEKLRRCRPTARLTAIARECSLDFLEGTGLFDQVDVGPRVPDYSFALKAIPRYFGKYGTACIIRNSCVGKWMRFARLCGIRSRVGASADSKRHRGVTIPIQGSFDYESDLSIAITESILGQRFADYRFRVGLNDTEADRLLVEAGIQGPFCVIHVSTGGSSPAYDTAGWASVAGQIVDQSGCFVVFTGGRGDAEPRLNHPRVKSLIGRTSIKGIASLLSKAEIALSCSTSVVHLCTAVGTPVVIVETRKQDDSEIIRYLPRSIGMRHYLVDSSGNPVSPDMISAGGIELMKARDVRTPLQLPPMSYSLKTTELDMRSQVVRSPIEQTA